jgi:hypothetical protein
LPRGLSRRLPVIHSVFSARLIPLPFTVVPPAGNSACPKTLPPFSQQEFRMPAAPVKFAYWVPNVSGGLVTSTIEQRTDWGYERELEVRLPAGEPESETVPAHA